MHVHIYFPVAHFAKTNNTAPSIRDLNAELPLSIDLGAHQRYQFEVLLALLLYERAIIVMFSESRNYHNVAHVSPNRPLFNIAFTNMQTFPPNERDNANS